jgi:alpha-tubulin suppressor-like RCC1 family protein
MWHACGSNSTGSLGVGDAHDSHSLRPTLPSLRSARDIVSGGRHTLFVDSVTTDGGSSSGLLVVGEGGCAGHGSTPLVIPAPLRTRLRIVSAACGWEHALLLSVGGHIFAVGAGGGGRLGCGNEAGVCEPAEVVLCDEFDGRGGAAPSAGGAVSAATAGNSGGAGGGGAGIIATAVAAGGAHSIAIDVLGRVWAWGAARAAAGAAEQGGRSRAPPILRPRLLSDANALLDAASHGNGGEVFVGVTAGWAFSAAWTSHGRVATWGENLWGQCGHGGSSGALTGADRAAAAPDSGGASTTAHAPRAPPVSPALVGGLPHSGVTGIAAGWAHSLALDSEGGVWAWGRSDLGQCGDGGAAPRVPAPARVALICGCAGAGRADAPRPRASRVAAGAESGAAVLTCGCACAWGWGEHGNLGDGDAPRVSAPRSVAAGGRVSDVRAAGAGLWVRVEV